MTAELKTLLTLSKSEDLYKGDFEGFISTLLYETAMSLDITRVSYWNYDNGKKEFRCYKLYNKDRNEYVSGMVISKNLCPNYYKSLESNITVIIDVTNVQNCTERIIEEYLNPNNIKSKLDSQIRFENSMLGILSFETEQERIWTQNEEYFSSTAATYISLAYTSKLRQMAEERMIESERTYRHLFDLNPFPMWVYSTETRKFLEVNEATANFYGYSRAEFFDMRVEELHLTEEKALIINYLMKNKDMHEYKKEWKHITKDCREIFVEMYASPIKFWGERAKIVLINNISMQKKAEKDRENMIASLTDYAFFTSHHLRGPVARVLGLLKLLELENTNEGVLDFDTMTRLKNVSFELDSVIREMNRKLDKGIFK